MGKLGTQENRIQLLPDNAERKAFREATGIGNNVDVVIDMSKMKPPKQAFDLYLKNLIRNPALSANAIRLGFLLFDLFENDVPEATFLVVPKSQFHMSRVGEDGFLFVHGTRQASHGFDLIEKQSLLEMAKSCRLNVSTAELIDLLNKLHSYFYITCTEVCEENLASNRNGFDYKKEEVSLSQSAEMVHIRINDRFNQIDLTNKWPSL